MLLGEGKGRKMITVTSFDNTFWHFFCKSSCSQSCAEAQKRSWSGMKELDITIWDSSPNRIIEIDKNLNIAASYEALSLNITIMSEIPLLGRNNLQGRLPVLEIGGKRWSLRPGKAFTVKECRSLLHMYALLLQNKE